MVTLVMVVDKKYLIQTISDMLVETDYNTERTINEQ